MTPEQQVGITHVSADGKRAWRVSNWQAGSAKYGPCRICGRPVDTVWAQVEFSRVEANGHDKLESSDDYFWVHEGSSHIGHADCLRKVRMGRGATE